LEKNHPRAVFVQKKKKPRIVFDRAIGMKNGSIGGEKYKFEY